MQHTSNSLMAVALLMAFTSWARADNWIEAIDGPLSSDKDAPTHLTLSVGSNLIEGSVSPSPIDPDFVTFDIQIGQTLESIVVTKYESNQLLSFIALQQGTSITSTTNGSELLGAALIGSQPGVAVGDDILDDLGEAELSGLGFEDALEPGSYTLWFQETAADVDYGLNLTIVPEPNTCAIFGLVFAFWFAIHRPRKRLC